jgi:hypothetical protein
MNSVFDSIVASFPPIPANLPPIEAEGLLLSRWTEAESMALNQILLPIQEEEYDLEDQEDQDGLEDWMSLDDLEEGD